MKPIVTIIIPTFNSHEFILESLNTLTGQTYPNWECLIIDDYSTDDTIKKVNDFILLQNDNRFKIIKKTTENKGQSAALNIGITEAKGKYILFLDSDDLFENSFIETRVNIFNNNMGLDVIFFPNYYRFKNSLENKDVVFNYIDGDDVEITCHFLEHKLPLPWNILSGIWSKEILNKYNGFNEGYLRLVDAEMSSRFLLNGINYKIIDNKPDYYYRYTLSTSSILEKRMRFFKYSNKYASDMYKLLKNKGNVMDIYTSSLKMFVRNNIKTLFISKQFDYEYFVSYLLEVDIELKFYSIKAWDKIKFLKKYGISDMPIINSILFRIIK